MKPGDQVIYDDSNAIEFSMNGVSYEIVNVEDIAAFIQEVE
jgi:co-chaperonin GroES (HSP10)